MRLDVLAQQLKAGEWAALVAQAEEAARLAAQRRALLVGPAGECRRGGGRVRAGWVYARA